MKMDLAQIIKTVGRVIMCKHIIPGSSCFHAEWVSIVLFYILSERSRLTTWDNEFMNFWMELIFVTFLYVLWNFDARLKNISHSTKSIRPLCPSCTTLATHKFCYSWLRFSSFGIWFDSKIFLILKPAN